MKKIFTLFIVSLITLSAFADGFRGNSMLTIKSQSRGAIKVVVDGRRFEPSDNFMRLQGLQPGDHFIKIYQEKTNGFFGYFGRRYEVVFNKSICVKPGTALTLSVDRWGRVSQSEIRFGGYGRDGNIYNDRDGRRGDRDNDRRGYDNDNRNSNWGNDYDKGHDFDFDNGRQGDFGWDNGRGRNDDGRDRQDDGRGRQDDGRGYDNQGYGNRMGQAMSDREFSGVMESISKEWFETNKIKSVTQIISGNYFTTAQVKQMVLLFSFETNKLDVAKQAYAHTIDKSNYYMINDALFFSSSKAELDRFIRTSR